MTASALLTEYWGRHQETIEVHREAVRLKPDDAQAWLYLGQAYDLIDRYPEAIEAYREALRLKPDYASAWYGLAIAYAKSGNRSATLEAVKELRRYAPERADSTLNLVHLNLELKAKPRK